MKTISVRPTLVNVDTITQFIRSELVAHKCGLKEQWKIAVAVDELFSNIVKHSDLSDSNDIIFGVDFEESPKSVLITVIDSGEPFNLLERRDPNVRLPARERKPGGLGIFMVKRIMDEISYEYKDGKNILNIRKYL